MQRQLSEEEIMALWASGSNRDKVFEALLDRYQQRTYWHIRRMVINHDDADDVLQNTFIKVWENLDRFRAESQLYTWIFKIASNEALRFLNKRKTVSLDDIDTDLLEHLAHDVYFNGTQAERSLQEAVLHLPEKQRLVFNLKYFDNMKYEEMSDVTGTSTGALKASYHHAVQKVEAFLKRTLNHA